MTTRRRLRGPNLAEQRGFTMSTSRKPAERIKDFNSLSEYKASTAKDGDIDMPIFDGHPIRRVIHNGEAHYSVVDWSVSGEQRSGRLLAEYQKAPD
jgi:hypothetical protein